MSGALGGCAVFAVGAGIDWIWELAVVPVAFLILATLFGLNLGPAVVLHEGSTLGVVLNSLRSLTYGVTLL